MKEYKYKINGTEYNVSIQKVENNEVTLEVNGTPYTVELPEEKKKTAPLIKKPTAPAPPANTTKNIERSVGAFGGGGIKAPLPGVIIDIVVKVGDEVKKGQKVAILEAMKMENNIESDRDGKVIEVKVKKGDSILEGTDIVIIG